MSKPRSSKAKRTSDRKPRVIRGKEELLAQMRREEEERWAKAHFEEYLDNDSMEDIALDMFETVKQLCKVSLEHVSFDPQVHDEVYSQLEIMRLRFEQFGIVVEWRDILPDYLKDIYGREEKL